MKKYNLGEVSDSKIKEALSIIRHKGGKIYTDNSFYICGIEGKYNNDEGSLIIIITNKPFYLGWKTIKNKLIEFFV